jgi:POT family proton-dependent oligopeptide transporter
LANTGERFGYYTMLAIFVLFLQAKFGFNEDQAGDIYGIFLAMVYFMPFVGGILADRWGYGKMVSIGFAVMFSGYLFLAVPVSSSLALFAMYASLFLISVGTGLFKGNLQVLVGNLYDTPEHRDKRDNAFSIFYMAINIGAMFAPTAATKVTNYFLAGNHFFYHAQIPSLAHQYLDGTVTPEGLERLRQLAGEQGVFLEDLGAFAQSYIESLAGAYNYGFGVACISLIASMLIYVIFRKTYKHADVNVKQMKKKLSGAVDNNTVILTPAQTRSRIVALALVFFVVIFFWMSFHQNGLTMTFFARDYTASSSEGFTRFGFDIFNLVLIAIAVYGGFALFQSATRRVRLISGGLLVAAVAGIIVRYIGLPEKITISPQIFQQFNPFFVVVLTPVSIALFGMLARKGKEPSTPRKIGMGMVIAAFGFAILACASQNLATPYELKDMGGVSDMRVSPNWLIGTYLVLTFAELLLSPMGISFVSKVAPPQYKGLMMGGWFAATAIGNYLTKLIAKIWGSGMPLWMIWSVLIVLCLLSAVFIFSIIKKLEKATQP